jgi:hypothetical protein
MIKKPYLEKRHHLEEYDRIKIKEAIHAIEIVYTYHYGDSYMRKELNRLETILKKLEELKSLAE